TRADLTEETIHALAMSMAFAAAVTAAGDRAKMLAEQLGQSSQQLYAAQKALAEASTLVAVGEMAAGAAHEINNPLAVIAGRAQLMADSAAEQDRQTWRTVAQQAQKISGIITEMMEFAKPPAPEAEPVSVRALIEGAKNAVRDNGETRDLIVEARLAPGTPKVFVDPKQMTAVLVELLTNARAACVKDPHALIEAAPDEATGKVLLRVVDKGAGMDAKMLESAFTPFFSACRAGRRRGLGLSKARRWVQLAGGKIWIVSRVEEGTSVFIQLPPASGSAEANEAGVAGK
ncbi:MAG: HAMP domain-containing histidine kinase, partial [Planctomycetes bacterium]|nr:HAMP domain-containing histidine kinase [Planctomycetota bacterium]